MTGIWEYTSSKFVRHARALEHQTFSGRVFFQAPLNRAPIGELR